MIAPGPKRMDTWCSDEMGNSWDQEEEVEIGMWSNNQQDSRSHDQVTWNYKHKSSNKVHLSHLCTFFLFEMRPFNKGREFYLFYFFLEVFKAVLTVLPSVHSVSDEQTSQQTG